MAETEKIEEIEEVVEKKPIKKKKNQSNKTKISKAEFTFIDSMLEIYARDSDLNRNELDNNDPQTILDILNYVHLQGILSSVPAHGVMHKIFKKLGYLNDGKTTYAERDVKLKAIKEEESGLIALKIAEQKESIVLTIALLQKKLKAIDKIEPQLIKDIEKELTPKILRLKKESVLEIRTKYTDMITNTNNLLDTINQKIGGSF